MKNEPVVHDKAFPVDASAGADNAYYLRHCAEVERGPSYASCLARLDDIRAGRSNERTAQCQQAVQQGRCTAAGMREQETLAGSALFYFPRLAKPFLPASVAGDFGVLITNHTDPSLYKAPPKPKAKDPTPEPAGYADAINAAMKDLAPAPAPTPAPAMKQVKEMVKAIPKEQLPPLPPKAAPMSLADFKKAALAEQPAPTPPAPPSPERTMQPGETPLQYARRMAALRNANK